MPSRGDLSTPPRHCSSGIVGLRTKLPSANPDIVATLATYPRYEISGYLNRILSHNDA